MCSYFSEKGLSGDWSSHPPYPGNVSEQRVGTEDVEDTDWSQYILWIHGHLQRDDNKTVPAFFWKEVVNKIIVNSFFSLVV